MEAFEDDFMVFERCGFDESVMNDSKDNVMKAMGSPCQWKKIVGGEGGEDSDEELCMSTRALLEGSEFPILTSLGNNAIPVESATAIVLIDIAKIQEEQRHNPAQVKSRTADRFIQGFQSRS